MFIGHNFYLAILFEIEMVIVINLISMILILSLYYYSNDSIFEDFLIAPSFDSLDK
jgi:hypothetical protein